MLNNFHMMQPFCCIRRRRMWQWFHAAEYILQHWPQYTSNYILSTEQACHNVQTNDKWTLWHWVENCLQCCFGSGSEMHELFTLHVQIMRPWICPDIFLTFLFLNSIIFYIFLSCFCCPHQEARGASTLQASQFWCWKGSCHKNDWTCSPMQRPDEKSRLFTIWNVPLLLESRGCGPLASQYSIFHSVFNFHPQKIRVLLFWGFFGRPCFLNVTEGRHLYKS